MIKDSKAKVALGVNNLHKSFRLPHESQNSFKGKLINFRKRGYETQEVLKGISFDVNPDGACSTFVATNLEDENLFGRNFDYVHSIYTDKLAVFNKLLVLRDIYRNGWIPNWEDASTKRDIEYANGRLIRNSCTNKSSVFSFQDHEIRNAFFNAFKEQLKEIKDLL